MNFEQQTENLAKNPINKKSISVTRIRFGLITTIVGFLIFLLGARPSIFGLRS